MPPSSNDQSSATEKSAPYLPQGIPLLLSQRLLTMLQLTRMALVFTAIADSFCGLLLRATAQARLSGLPDSPRWIWRLVGLRPLAAIALMSIGLYAFGMSLNDIIDRRRDRQFSPGRPLPSGRIGVVTAHIVCALFGLGALAAGALYAHWTSAGWPSVVLLAWTILLITFYDFAGKYLVWTGLLTLGLIRFFHSIIPAPDLPLLWQPLLLLNHVAILSTVAYVWEEKRPPLTRVHWWGVLGGLGLFDLAATVLVGWDRFHHAPIAHRGLREALWITPGLLWPIAAVIAFVLLAALIHHRTPSRREAGQKLMLYGLLWLIVYDAAFAMGYVNWRFAAALLVLLPVAYLSVQLMRAWSKLMQLSKTPQYVRAGVDDLPPGSR